MKKIKKVKIIPGRAPAAFQKSAPLRQDLTPPPGLGLKKSLRLSPQPGQVSPGSSEESSTLGKEGIKPDRSEMMFKVVRDFAALPFEMWHAGIPEVPPLTDEAKDKIATPLFLWLEEADLLERYAKPLYNLIVRAGMEIAPRIRITKDVAKAKAAKKEGGKERGDLNDHSREKKTGQDEPDKTPDIDGKNQ